MWSFTPLFIYNKHMVNFKIKIANIVLEINAFYEITKEYCKDFLSDEEPQWTITLTEEDLENELHIREDGKVYASEEISALYRKIAAYIKTSTGYVFFKEAKYSVKSLASDYINNRGYDENVANGSLYNLAFN